MLTSVQMYTAETHEGNDYSTSQTISSVFVSQDGAEVKDYELSIIDEGIATIENVGSEWKIQACKAGKTNLIVAFGNTEYAFDVLVERPVCVLNQTADYSYTDKKYFDRQTETLKPITELVEGFSNVVSYEFAGKEYKLREGSLELPIGKKQTLTLYSESVGYQLAVNVYTTIMDELADFEKIYAGDTQTDVTGEYLLGKDIIEPNTVLSLPAGKVPNNFAGVFDGDGHVLSFTFLHGDTYRIGLFGQFLKGATIKNLALYNVTKGASAGKNPSGILCGEGSDGNVGTGLSTLENIFVDLKFCESGASNLALMGNAMWATEFKNVIVHVPEVPISDTYGSFARGEAASVSNSYVISTAPLYVTNVATNYKVVPTLYADYNAMKSAGNDYSSFNTKYWDVETYGIPVWKTLVEDFVF